MRILLVNTRHYRGGGDSTYTFNLADLLRAKGHEVAFFAMRDSHNLPDPNDDLFVSPIDFAELNRRRSVSDGLRVLGRAIYSREAREKFARLLDRVRPDIVHAQSLHGHITPSIFPEARRRGIPVVWTLHDYKTVCPNSHLLIDKTGQTCTACTGGAFYQAVRRRCKKESVLPSAVAALEAYGHRWLGVHDQVDHFLAPSAFLHTTIMAMGSLDPSRFTHLPYCLPARAFTGPGGAGQYLLFSGRVTPIKGIFPLLKAIGQVPEARLVLAGRIDGSLANELTRLLPRNAEYVGFKHGEELEALIAGATAVLAPSIWYENQPFSILEAFAAGRPVIASDLGALPELVPSGERGLLAPPHDIGGLAAAIRSLLEQPEAARRWGENAFRYARAEHEPDAHYERLMRIYASVRGHRG